MESVLSSTISSSNSAKSFVEFIGKQNSDGRLKSAFNLAEINLTVSQRILYGLRLSALRIPSKFPALVPKGRDTNKSARRLSIIWRNLSTWPGHSSSENRLYSKNTYVAIPVKRPVKMSKEIEAINGGK